MWHIATHVEWSVYVLYLLDTIASAAGNIIVAVKQNMFPFVVALCRFLITIIRSGQIKNRYTSCMQLQQPRQTTTMHVMHETDSLVETVQKY